MEQYAQHPELFPEGIEEGFSFHDVIPSSKQNLRMRRIKLKRNEEVYQLRPSFVMPYMIDSLVLTPLSGEVSWVGSGC